MGYVLSELYLGNSDPDPASQCRIESQPSLEFLVSAGKQGLTELKGQGDART